MRNVFNSTLKYKFGENPAQYVVTAEQKSTRFVFKQLDILLRIVLYVYGKR